MNTYTIYWTPDQQSALLSACIFLNAAEAEWILSEEFGDHFALVQSLNSHQYDDCVDQYNIQNCMGIKPGANPGGNPNGL